MAVSKGSFKGVFVCFCFCLFPVRISIEWLIIEFCAPKLPLLIHIQRMNVMISSFIIKLIWFCVQIWHSLVLLHSNKSTFVFASLSVLSNQEHPDFSRILPFITSSHKVLCPLVLLSIFCLCIFTGFCERVIVLLFCYNPELSILANLTIRQSSVLSWMPKITKHLSFLEGLCHIFRLLPLHNGSTTHSQTQ